MDAHALHTAGKEKTPRRKNRNEYQINPFKVILWISNFQPINLALILNKILCDPLTNNKKRVCLKTSANTLT